jgi:purine-nucleoside phosphorylase
VLKDLTKTDWLTILSIPEQSIPPVLVLRGTRNLRSRYQAILPFFQDIVEIGSPNGIFEDVLIGKLRGLFVGFACVYGASMASEIVHVFGKLGTRAVIQTGNCGALADDFSAGDLFVPDRAYCGEGAAEYYMTSGKWVAASENLLKAKSLYSLHPRVGQIYTTAALLAEGMEDLDRWFRQGFAAVDMETATTFAVAESFGMDRLALLYAFDNPRQREHLLLCDADKDVRRVAANATVTEAAFNLAVELAAGYG